MSIDHLRPRTLTGVRSLTKQIKKRDGVSHSATLDQASVQAGCTDYRHALASISVIDADPSSTAEPALRLRT